MTSPNSTVKGSPAPDTRLLWLILFLVIAAISLGLMAVSEPVYALGAIGMGWHADDEPELGRNPVIASVSLGATRRFCLRHRRRKGLKLDLPLPHGSLLCMSGETQHHWLHAVPKTRLPVGERVNLTFRLVALR